MRSRVLSFGRTYTAIRSLTDEMKRDRIGTYAAESAFFLILSALPLVTLTVTIARLVIPDFVSDYILRLAELVPGIIGDYIESEFMSFSVYPAPAPLSLSAVAVLWGASRGVRAVRRGVRSVWNEDGGSPISEAIYGISFTAAFILIIVAVLVFLVFGDELSEMIGARFPVAGDIFDLAVGMSPVFSMFALTLFFTLLYGTFTPPSSGIERLRSHLPGAALAASGWTLYSYIFSIFISDFSDMPRIYGSLAAIMILMLWLYMIMYILLLGAEVNKLLSRRAKRMRRHA